jgi:amidase
LAAGLTALEAGSDIGASIRSPSHYCGVYGHKPSHGIVPLRGQAGPGRVAGVDLFVSGPMARSAADLEVALLAMAGPDVLEAAGWQLTLPKCTKRSLSDFRIAVMTSGPDSDVDREVQGRLHALTGFLGRSGAKVSDTARPDIDLNVAHATCVRLLRSATSRRHTPEVFARHLEAARTLSSDDDSYTARMVRANTIYHRDWLHTDEVRERLRYGWAEFFKDYDLLLCPAAATAAFPHDQKGDLHERTLVVNGKTVPFSDQFFWAGISTLVHLPATVAPMGLTLGGLPVGVQIVGPGYGDLTCIRFAELLEKEYYAFTPPPGFQD